MARIGPVDANTRISATFGHLMASKPTRKSLQFHGIPRSCEVMSRSLRVDANSLIHATFRHLIVQALDGQQTYTNVAAGSRHRVLLRSDGSHRACECKQMVFFNFPMLDGQQTYTQVVAGTQDTVVVRSDGSALAWGGNESAQCYCQALDGQLAYTQVATCAYCFCRKPFGYFRTSALRGVTRSCLGGLRA